MRKTIGLREIRKLQPGDKIWDTKVRGFHARCQIGAGVSYLLFYRTREGRTRWHTIGRHGSPWTPDTARGLRIPHPRPFDGGVGVLGSLERLRGGGAI